jgi:hypothetical protein
MCILSVFCELSLKIHLFPDNSVLHRNKHYVIFHQVETSGSGASREALSEID